MTISPTLFLVILLVAPLGVVMGAIMGSWITYRARMGKSPLPTVPSPKAVARAFREEQPAEPTKPPPPRMRP